DAAGPGADPEQRPASHRADVVLACYPEPGHDGVVRSGHARDNLRPDRLYLLRRTARRGGAGDRHPGVTRGGGMVMSLRALPWVLLIVLTGCMEGQKPTPRQKPTAQKNTLYERLGGEPAIAKVVDDFVAEVVADPKIKDRHKKHFMDDNVAALKRKLI